MEYSPSRMDPFWIDSSRFFLGHFTAKNPQALTYPWELLGQFWRQPHVWHGVYIRHRKDRFGATASDVKDSDCRILDTIMSQVILDPVARSVWTRKNAPTTHTSSVSPMTFYLIMTLWYACELIEAEPSLFVPTTKPRASPLVFDPYDLVHAWKLLALCGAPKIRAACFGSASPSATRRRCQSSSARMFAAVVLSFVPDV